MISLALILWTAGAWAKPMPQIDRVQSPAEDRVQIRFNRKVAPSQIQVAKTEYLPEVIQITLSGVAIYPARVFALSKGEIQKVFAYQYGPDTVRIRLTVPSPSERFKDRFQLKVDQSGYWLIASMGKSQAVTPTLTPTVAVSPANAVVAPIGTKLSAKKEKELLGEVLKQPGGAAAASAATVAGPFRVFVALGVVIACFFAAVVLVKKSRGPAEMPRVMRFFRGFMPDAVVKRQPIEIVSKHHLGPKKSICVVKISGKTLVLGVTEEQINLITRLDEESDDSGAAEIAELSAERPAGAESAGAPKFPASTFSDVIASKVEVGGTREQIRRRLERIEEIRPS